MDLDVAALGTEVLGIWSVQTPFLVSGCRHLPLASDTVQRAPARIFIALGFASKSWSVPSGLDSQGQNFSQVLLWGEAQQMFHIRQMDCCAVSFPTSSPWGKIRCQGGNKAAVHPQLSLAVIRAAACRHLCAGDGEQAGEVTAAPAYGEPQHKSWIQACGPVPSGVRWSSFLCTHLWCVQERVITVCVCGNKSMACFQRSSPVPQQNWSVSSTVRICKPHMYVPSPGELLLIESEFVFHQEKVMGRAVGFPPQCHGQGVLPAQ